MLLDFSSPLATLYSVVEIINYVIIIFCSLGFVSQLFFTLFMWVKNKKLKKADNYANFAVCICARNEEDVIFDTIERIKKTTTYPIDKITFFVCCHNCNDKTHEEALRAGAIVYDLNDDNPKHAMVAYPYCYLISKIKQEYKGKFDLVTRIDADNILHKNFFEEMNNGYYSGFKAMRGYIASANLTQNNWTLASALYYMRDSRVVCQTREAFHLDMMLDGGAGITLTSDTLDKFEGQFLTSVSEDSELSLKLIYKKIRIHYVKDAIVYNDHPSNFKDTSNRNIRMGHGLNLLFLKESPKMLLKSITLGKFSLIDLFLQLLFIPTSFFSLGWILPYYLILLTFHCFNAFLPNGVSFMAGLGWMSQEMSLQNIITIATSGITFLIFFALLYIISALIVLKSAEKTLGINFKKCVKSAFIAPLFMLLYNFSIFAGIVSKPKWKKVQRSKNFEGIK